MHRQNLLTPISILIAGIILIVMVMSGPEAQSDQAKQNYPQQSPTTLAYGGPTTQNTNTPTTVSAITNTPATSTPTQTSTAIATISTTILATIPTLTPTQPVATRTIVATAQSNIIILTATATPTTTLSCNPGQPMEITGKGPPYAGFLLYFGDRIVSGGSISASGQFSIQMIVGEEQAGEYSVTVRERGTERVLSEFVCTVPATTPTPLPPRHPR